MSCRGVSTVTEDWKGRVSLCCLYPWCVLFISVVDNSSNWAVCGKSCGVISMPLAAQATHRVHMEVMPLFAGYLPLPDVRLFKYLPHHSAHASQLDAGKEYRGQMRLHRCSCPAKSSMLAAQRVGSFTADPLGSSTAVASHSCRTVSTELVLNAQL